MYDPYQENESKVNIVYPVGVEQSGHPVLGWLTFKGNPSQKNGNKLSTEHLGMAHQIFVAELRFRKQSSWRVRRSIPKAGVTEPGNRFHRFGPTGSIDSDQARLPDENERVLGMWVTPGISSPFWQLSFSMGRLTRGMKSATFPPAPPSLGLGGSWLSFARAEPVYWVGVQSDILEITRNSVCLKIRKPRNGGLPCVFPSSQPAKRVPGYTQRQKTYVPRSKLLWRMVMVSMKGTIILVLQDPYH